MKVLSALPLFLFPVLLFAVPPEARKQPVKDVYHGVSVLDEYRWLEDVASKEVKAWSDAENAHARAYLSKLPGAAKLRNRLKEILTAKTIKYTSIVKAGGKLFALKRSRRRNNPSWSSCLPWTPPRRPG